MTDNPADDPVTLPSGRRVLPEQAHRLACIDHEMGKLGIPLMVDGPIGKRQATALFDGFPPLELQDPQRRQA